MSEYTHEALTIRAERWLLGTVKCNFAFRELGSVGSEIPDAIGWREGFISTLVECKTSRADFRADRKKWHRRIPENGMGMFRYMLCPKDMIQPEELPEGWGLLYCLPKTIRRIKKAENQPRNHRAEMTLLTSALRRVHLRGDLEKIYEYPPAHKPLLAGGCDG
ncbi:hypothetical protein [Maridesulfovibrio sp.]|uniref:hypothetical protein n=1 Tax=Maridesulfovibrio sp. TaxID=2795000 RepID=UPI0029CA0C41|nr:hypothetical protein [Maridesulfovibrio sp.]